MSVRLSLCIAAVFLTAVRFASADERVSTITPDIGMRVARDFVDPVLGAFDEESGALQTALEDLCGAPSADALSEAREAFSETVAAWAPVSVLRFGPLVADHRFERVFFWPDVRGVTLRQVQGLLASTEALPDDMAGLSVAMQGLPALEYMLYGDGAEALGEPDGARRCALAARVAENIATVSDGLLDGWAEGTDFHGAFTAPAADRDPYRSPGEVAAEIVKAAGTALQFARNAELLPALGEEAEAARGRRAPFWRSRQTFAFAAAQIDGVRELVEAAGFVDGPSDLVNGYGRGMVFDVGHARDALLSVTGAPEDAFAEAEDRGRISYATVAMEGAKHTLNGELAGALGLVMGFNALDGD